MENLYRDARVLIDQSIKANLPGQAVRSALRGHALEGSLYLLAVGKAAWTMAQAAHEELGDRIKRGIVITKYDHSQGEIPGMEIVEAGHPLLDQNSLEGTARAVKLAESLGAGDQLLFLISGGGSALFESPLPGLGLEDILSVTDQLLACGADIVEINTIRKHLSAVKGGRFAQLCAPAKVFTVVLSDVLGDRLDSIASGPAAPDQSTVEDALGVVEKYGLKLTETQMSCLRQETPKSLDNVESVVTGSVRTLCDSAAAFATELGYKPHILCTDLDCEAREAGRMMAAIARQIHQGGGPFTRPCAVLLGGETVVHLKGSGKGGRNQELALAAAEGIAGIPELLVFSFGSDGTDGPTDAAGGVVDGETAGAMVQRGLDLAHILDNNDAYNGLKAVGGLIVTGPTGTNVNDCAVILCK